MSKTIHSSDPSFIAALLARTADFPFLGLDVLPLRYRGRDTVFDGSLDMVILRTAFLGPWDCESRVCVSVAALDAATSVFSILIDASLLFPTLLVLLFPSLTFRFPLGDMMLVVSICEEEKEQPKLFAKS
jgi:hypothetical protein